MVSNLEERATQLGKKYLKQYCRNYLGSLGEAYREYMKLLLEAAPEDRSLIAEAFKKAYTDMSTGVVNEVLAELLEVSVEDMEHLLPWIQSPGPNG